MAKFNEFLFGRKDKAKRFQQYTPEQMQAMNQLWQGLSGGGGAFNDLFGSFNPEETAGVFQRGVADPAMRNFRQNMMPQIMEGFADQGASSGLSNSLAGAASNLQSDLAAQMEMFMNQARMQQMQQRMSGLNQFMNANPYQTYIQGGDEGLLPGMLKQFAQGAGRSVMGGFGF